jgi:hypothetical protein
VQGNVYVLVCGSAAQLKEGLRRNESLEGKTEEYSRSLGTDALEMVVGERGEKMKKDLLFKI